MVEAIAPLLKTLSESLEAEAYVQWYPKSPASHAFWSVSIHAHGRCFAGTDDTDVAQALLKANASRQRHEDAMRDAPVEQVA
jgi:S-methylmethionine-dependent homocysteine/selenocysteine methylase